MKIIITFFTCQAKEGSLLLLKQPQNRLIKGVNLHQYVVYVGRQPGRPQFLQQDEPRNQHDIECVADLAVAAANRSIDNGLRLPGQPAVGVEYSLNRPIGAHNLQ